MVRTIILGLLAATLPAAAQAAWQEASSSHFVVYSDDTSDNVRAFTARLERYDRAMRVLRGLSEDGTSRASRVTVFVVKNVSAIERLAKDDNVAGFYIPRADGSVAFTPRTSGDGTQTALTAQEVLLHEYAHHITFMAWGREALPAWFVEGFAEFNATATFGADGSVTFGLPPYYRARTMLKLEAVPIKTLLTADPNTLPAEERDIFYGRAWLLVHYLATDATRRHQLSDYLERIGKGQPAMEAASAFGNPAKLDVALNRYARQPKITTFTLFSSQLAPSAVAVRPLTPAETAALPALILSKRGVNAKTAPAALAQARIAAAAWPADAFVENEAAEAEFDAGNYDAAGAAATRALAADPKSIHALMYQGMARMAVAAKAKDKNPAAWNEARHWFSLANHVDPDDPWPLLLYYQSYAAAGQEPTANAEQGLLYAHRLAPFDGSVSLAAARVDLHQGKPDDARTALRPVAYNPHGGYEATLARATLAAMDKDGAAAAAQVLTDGKVKATDPTGATGKKGPQPPA